MLPVDAGSETFALAGLIEYVQAGCAADCETENALPATVAVALRPLVAVFAAML